MWGSNPTPTLTGEWLMTMVHDILQQMPGLGQPQRKFLATLFVTILVLRGRVNFRNLSRYCDYSERTIAWQFRVPFDWPDFHQRVLMTALAPHSELISAHDASFISKSGKQTFGLGHFFNGCASRAEPGWKFPTSRGWMSHAGALLRSPVRRRRRERKPYRLSGKKPGSTSTRSNCASIGIACPRAST